MTWRIDAATIRAFSWWLQPHGEQLMSVYKRGKGTHWHYYFRVRGVRYRGSIPEARTKQKAEQAKSKIKQEIFEKRFELEQKGTDLLSDFLDDVYLPWSKVNKNRGAMMSIWSVSYTHLRAHETG